MEKMDYRAMVNPTYLTAKSTLLMLAGVGNEDAKRVISALNIQDELSQNARGKSLPIPEDELKALMRQHTGRRGKVCGSVAFFAD